MGWIQLRKYYEKTDECPAYATALLLHPAHRAKYINTNWLEEWRPSAFESVEMWVCQPLGLPHNAGVPW